MATSLLTTKIKSYLGYQIHEAIEERANTAFYVYAGVHGDVIGDIPVPADDNRTISIDAYRNMMFGKRVTESDVMLVIRNIPWESGKVFAMYDDNDDELLTKDFYCIVDEGSLFHVYKCLDNNFGLPSTVEPTYSYVEPSSNYIFTTSDDYVWKYMYSVSSTVVDKFSTQNYFPANTNSDVAAAAIKGAVDIIRIEQNDLEIPGGGKRYDNYVSGTFSTAQVRVNGNNYLYAISNDNISYDAGFYTGCLLYISGGTGAGQYKTVTDYFHNANGNFIVIEAPFDTGPTNGSTFEIFPEVKIKGSGQETVTAVARALVNATGSNSVYKIEMMEKGADYDYLYANVIANSVITDDVAFVEAELHPIYAPESGHGVDSPEELGSNWIEFSVQFANSEANTIPTDNRYQQIGLIKDPAFSNVVIFTTNTAGSFLEGEMLYKITPTRINANINITNTATTITGESSTLSNASIVTDGADGSYVPGDVMDISGGTPTTTSQILVVSTHVRAATINAHGSGYTPGNFNANINLGTAVTNCTITVTVNSIGQCNSLVINNPGVFTTNPPYLANTTPVEGVAGSGLTVALEMGLEEIDIYEAGSYAVIPTDLATNEPVANSGNGTGAELLITFDTTLSADFTGQLAAGDYVYIRNIEKSQQQLAIVDSITNSTSLEISVNGYFNCSMAYMYLPNITSSAEIVETANSTILRISDVDQEIVTDDLLVGFSSGAKAQANVISRNDVEKNFDTFVQMYKYDISMLADEFAQNEMVYQGTSLANATASALVHSVVNTGVSNILYTSNQVGQFAIGTLLYGANSLAVADINSAWGPELEFASGDVLYMENIEPVNRSSSNSETFQIVIGF